MIAACLLFDRRYSAEGWLCCRSIHEHAPSAKIYVLCLDEKVLEESRGQRVTGIPLADLEQRFPALADTKRDRSWPAYTQTCKVFFPAYVFEKFEEEVLCYVDSDMYFWQSIAEVERVLGSSSFMVASREDRVRPPQGEFNGGFFACRNDAHSRRFFAWWQDRTIKWCEWRPASGGRFGEEGYLNVFVDEPDRFENISICPHPGMNLARWNAGRHELSMEGGSIMIDGRWPLVCYHYHAFEADDPRLGLGASPKGVLRFMYEEYRDKLIEAMRR